MIVMMIMASCVHTIHLSRIWSIAVCYQVLTVFLLFCLSTLYHFCAKLNDSHLMYKSSKYLERNTVIVQLLGAAHAHANLIISNVCCIPWGIYLQYRLHVSYMGSLSIGKHD